MRIEFGPLAGTAAGTVGQATPVLPGGAGGGEPGVIYPVQAPRTEAVDTRVTQRGNRVPWGMGPPDGGGVGHNFLSLPPFPAKRHAQGLSRAHERFGKLVSHGVGPLAQPG
jgi:hypothetical protein